MGTNRRMLCFLVAVAVIIAGCTIWRHYEEMQDELTATQMELQESQTRLNSNIALVITTKAQLKNEKIKTEGLEQVIEELQADVLRLEGTPAPAPAPTKDATPSGRSKRFVVTAYCPCAKCCGKYASGYTANGTKAAKGVCAVDTRVIPFGTVLTIPGYGKAVAADRGGAIKGNHIDVCFDTHSEALAWGKKTLTVTY